MTEQQRRAKIDHAMRELHKLLCPDEYPDPEPLSPEPQPADCGPCVELAEELPHEATAEEVALLRKVALLAAAWDSTVAETLESMIASYRDMIGDKVSGLFEKAFLWRGLIDKRGGYVLFKNFDYFTVAWVPNKRAEVEPGLLAVGADTIWQTGKTWRKIATAA